MVILFYFYYKISKFVPFYSAPLHFISLDYKHITFPFIPFHWIRNVQTPNIHWSLVAIASTLLGTWECLATGNLKFPSMLNLHVNQLKKSVDVGLSRSSQIQNSLTMSTNHIVSTTKATIGFLAKNLMI